MKVENSCSGKDLLNVDLEDSSKWKRTEDIDVGIGARQALLKGKVKQIDALHFRNECRAILVLIVKKLRERSPLAFPLTRYVSGFSPIVMKNPTVSVKRVTKFIEALVETWHLDAIDGERSLR